MTLKRAGFVRRIEHGHAIDLHAAMLNLLVVVGFEENRA
jgi:hypothetical protein